MAMKVKISGEIAVAGVSPPFSMQGEYNSPNMIWKLDPNILHSLNWINADFLVAEIDADKQLWFIYEGLNRKPASEVFYPTPKISSHIVLYGTINDLAVELDCLFKECVLDNMIVDTNSEFVLVKSDPKVYALAENDFWEKMRG